MATREFEQSTGRKVPDADETSLAIYQESLENRGLSNGTIRHRLSVISVLSGVKFKLPKRLAVQPRPSLTAEQVRALMSAVTDFQDRFLLVRLLTLGAKAGNSTEGLGSGPSEPITFNLPGMIVHIEFTEPLQRNLKAQQVSRLLKRYAKRAGINEKQVSLRVWCQSGQVLIRNLGAMELVNIIGHNPDPSKGVDWKPFHGIGRRSKRR